MPRLLVIKLGAIGDCVMAIPAAHAMHHQGYEVDWVCGHGVASVLRLYPWIKVLAIDDRALLQGTSLDRLRALLELWRLTSTHMYDLCVALYYDRRYRLLTLPIRARRKLLLSKNSRATTLIPGRHHTDEYARILLARPDDQTPTQLAPVSLPALAPTRLARIAGKPRIVLVPGGARNMLRDDALRRWPLENYVALAEALLANGCNVVLSGGPEDAWVCPPFQHLRLALARAGEGGEGGEGVDDVIGTLSLVESLSLFDSADVVITHDTGPLHLAGLTRSAVIGIFGPTDPHGRLPQRANCVALWGGEGFACRPCYDGRDYAPCTHNGCIRQVTPALVLNQVHLLIAAASEGRSLPPRILTPERVWP